MIFKDDRLEVTFTYLEMHEPPSQSPTHPPNLKHPVMLTRIMDPTISFYRYLYNVVGEPWLWYERRIMDDEKLRHIIHDDKIEIYCLFVGGVPAGYAELNRHEGVDIELSYFGLVPEFIGKGLGRYFLEAMAIRLISPFPTLKKKYFIAALIYSITFLCWRVGKT